MGVIYKSSFCLPFTLLILCCSLVYPDLVYCASVWASTYPTTSSSPTSKKIIQIISKKPFDAHIDPISKSHEFANSD